MKLTEITQPNQPILDQHQLFYLIELIGKYCAQAYNLHAKQLPDIQKATSLFPYKGKMHRTIFVIEQDDGDVDLSNIEHHILNHEEKRELSSWSQTKKGMNKWLENIQDIEFANDEYAIYECYGSQTGLGFDVVAFNNYLNNPNTQQVINQSNQKPTHLTYIKRAALVGEVIAPYYSNFRVDNISEFYNENYGIEYDDDDEYDEDDD